MAFTQRNTAAGPGKGIVSAVSKTMSEKAKMNATKTSSKPVTKKPVTKITTLPEVTVTAKRTTPKMKTLPEVTVTAKKKFSEPYKYFIGKEVGGKTEMVSKAQYEAHKGVKTRMQTDASGNPVEGGSGGKVYTNYDKKVKKKY